MKTHLLKLLLLTNHLGCRPQRARIASALLALTLFALAGPVAHAQTTAFTYQGSLADGGRPANGNYDFRFTLHDAPNGGVPVAGPLTNAPVTVSNGLFTTTLDFGAGAFPGADRYLEIATRHSERLGRLVDELFELAKLDAGVTPLQVEPFSLSELVQDTVQRFELAAQRKRVTIAVDYAQPVPFVHGDIGLIERVLANLFDNALRYTDADGTIRIQLSGTDGRISVQVSDTGRGIAPEDLPHVFDRFFRSNPHSSSDGGAGLGLAIAQRIVELHGGRIKVQSAMLRGTTFHFDLPARVSV